MKYTDCDTLENAHILAGVPKRGSCVIYPLHEHSARPSTPGSRYGVAFVFNDGWHAAHFQLTKEEAERQAARVGESEPVP
jgi:hypothetical protein